jgi:hypothetical protein
MYDYVFQGGTINPGVTLQWWVGFSTDPGIVIFEAKPVPLGTGTNNPLLVGQALMKTWDQTLQMETAGGYTYFFNVTLVSSEWSPTQYVIVGKRIA